MYPDAITAHNVLTQHIGTKNENREASHFTKKINKVMNVIKQPFTIYAKYKDILETSSEYSFCYMDSIGLDKKYAAGETHLIKAKDTPFEAALINHLIGMKNPEKTNIIVTCTAIEVPMTGADGHRYLVRSNFVHYRGAKGQITIMPNGEIDISESQHMKRNMLPGMKRISGEFAVYEIPKNQMIQKTRGTFSSFTFINE
ncbi:hypothetical protein GA565_08545 [Rouxiella sp. S1S-2]|uniref:hypothetical protein n=1 Tax=Rouxiella sp. S1S-2 TaxID=2653856 RepID=UPI001263EE21|nr:hypothetical protein [Rouxiella sp. S1S-2]KAB7896031.1 hypothetical protein GA565_08545 [Rouxiella sp. S1S-2]